MRRCSTIHLVSAVFVLVGGANIFAQTAAVSVGDPQKPADLPQAISDAYGHGGRDITIAPGIYHLPSRHHEDTIVMDRWRDATIHAAGATLIFEEVDRRPLSFRKCKNVIWDGGTLLFIHPLFHAGPSCRHEQR